MGGWNADEMAVGSGYWRWAVEVVVSGYCIRAWSSTCRCMCAGVDVCDGTCTEVSRKENISIKTPPMSPMFCTSLSCCAVAAARWEVIPSISKLTQCTESSLFSDVFLRIAMARETCAARHSHHSPEQRSPIVCSGVEAAAQPCGTENLPEACSLATTTDKDAWDCCWTICHIRQISGKSDTCFTLWVAASLDQSSRYAKACFV